MDQNVELPKEKVAVRQRSRGGWIGWVIFLLIIAVAGAYLYQRPLATPPQTGNRRNAQPMSVGTATIEKGAINVTVDALGTVTSLATVTVKSQVSGPLIQVNFKEGQDVKKGDLLAQIDPRPYQAALAQAQAQLDRDQALLKGAQVDLARYQGLATQNAVPRQTLDTQVALVAQDEATVSIDKALIQAATVNLGYCRILAPVDGRAGLRQIDEGNYVTPGDANGIVVITQIQPISVIFTVPEDQLQAIAQRMQQGATLPTTAMDRTGRNKLADGQLETFDSQIDSSTGTIKLRAAFTNETRNLFPNQFVNIELLVDQHKDVAIAPTAAVQRGVPGTFVYLVDADNTVSVRKITLGVTNGERIEVLSGLNPGDRVVVDGADKLRDGAKINLQQDGQPATSAQPAAQAQTPAQTPGQTQTPAQTPQAQAPPAGQQPADDQNPGDAKHKGQGRKHRHSETGQQQ